MAGITGLPWHEKVVRLRAILSDHEKHDFLHPSAASRLMMIVQCDSRTHAAERLRVSDVNISSRIVAAVEAHDRWTLRQSIKGLGILPESTPVSAIVMREQWIGALERAGFGTIGALARASEVQLAKCRGLGERGLVTIREILASYGIALRTELQDDLDAVIALLRSRGYLVIGTEHRQQAVETTGMQVSEGATCFFDTAESSVIMGLSDAKNGLTSQRPLDLNNKRELVVADLDFLLDQPEKVLSAAMEVRTWRDGRGNE